jgi:serine/threonine-protein kinase
MTRHGYDRLIAVFDGACARPVEERAAFLDEACAGDSTLRSDVEKLLLANEQSEGLLESPAVHMAFVGAHIGAYRIEAEVGEGGMGRVFLARDTKLNRPVAIKFLTGDAVDAAARRRFQREAQTASSLNHPHIVTVHDVGEWRDRQYLVTEYLEGGTLKDWVTSGKRTWREIVELLAGVADGLATAHGAGILHRDIKPANILIHRSGYAKLADFGLAKMVQDSVRREVDHTRTEGPTKPGVVVGTIAYMSPEQASGKPLDARSDVFSFGVVLYEALSGRRPFAGATDLEVLQTIIHGTAQPLTEDMPQPIRTLVHKALEKNPAQRYQSMREMVVDLRRLTRESVETPPRPLVHLSRRSLLMAAGAAITIALVILAISQWRAGASETLRSVAVLPLENVSGDPGEEYFSDGMTGELISELAHISSLHVISRTSVMRYKGGGRKRLPEIARELNVEAVVEGTVAKVGDKVRISAQLIRARDDRHLWSQKYERNLTDILALQGEVARAIAVEIRAALKPEEKSRWTRPREVNPEAYQAFLQGNYFLHQNIRGIAKSIDLFRRAIELDPTHADAHAGLAHALVYTGIYEIRPPAQAYTEARMAAQAALHLDAANAGAHNVLADVKKSFEWDLAGAEQEHHRALRLSPSHLLTRLWLADTLSRLERHDEALAESARAVSLEPVSALTHNNRSMLLYRARQYDESIEEARIALELDPSHVNALWWQGLAYAEKRDFTRALGSLEKGSEMSSKAPMFLASLGYTHARAAQPDKAYDAIRSLQADKRYVSAVNIATVYAGLGDADRTFEWLEKACQARDGRVQQLVWPLFDDFRRDPRYMELKGRIGLR